MICPDGEGIGWLHGVWMILNEAVDYTSRIIAIEADYITHVGAAAASIDDHEDFAKVIGGDGEIDELRPEPLQRLDAAFSDIFRRPEGDEDTLQGLEPGVSGWAHTLFSIGAVPAASCRGHDMG